MPFESETHTKDPMLMRRNELSEDMKLNPVRTAAKISLGYAGIGWLWVLVSDKMVPLLTQDLETMVLINSAKGSLFIFATAFILFLLVYSQLKRIGHSQSQYIRSAWELGIAHNELAASEEEMRRQLDELAATTKLLQEKDREMWEIFENMHDAFAFHEIICDDEGNASDFRFLAANPAYERMFGVTRAEIIGQRARDVSVDFDNEWFHTCGEVALTGATKKIKTFSKSLNRYLSISVHSPKHGRFAVLARDITDEKAHQELVERLAYHDVLTGLPNRARLNDVLKSEMDEKVQGQKMAGALLYIDMDDLKMVNDSYGHSYGDAMLITAAMHVVSVVEAGSLVARVGGDEFIVLMPGAVDYEAVEHIARELVETLCREYEVREVCFHSSASIGIAMYPQDGTSAEEILKNADTALYEAKRSGKRCWRFFQKSMQETAYGNMVLTNGLRNAVANRELHVHYQPQISLTGYNVVAYEALLRWQSPQHGNVSPAQFIPLAEKSALIETIGEWVLQESCQFARRLADLGKENIRIAVNVSPRQLAAADFMSIVQNALQTAGISPGQLEIEITESVFIESMEDSVQKLNKLRELGVHLSLDDFGTGYSSLTYLRRLPVETVKIDKSFIDLISADTTHAALIASIIDMAHVLGLSVVAEGVETEMQLEKLVLCHCDIMQGYLASKALPEPEAMSFLNNNTSLLQKGESAMPIFL